MLDLEPGSAPTASSSAALDMPNVGDELHHFGWNACSSALCPWAPHPHVERRYLLVPGPALVADPRPRRQGRPARARSSPRSSRPRRSPSKTGYSRPHTVHCGPDGIYVSALGNPDGDGPGGIFLLDHDNFSVKGAWEADRGPQELAYDFWWHLNHGTVITSEWGTPNMVEDGLVGELLLGNQYGHKLHVWDLETRKHVQEIDLGAEHQMVLELRPGARPAQGLRLRRRRHLDRRPVGLGLAVGARRRRHRSSAEKVITIPPEPAEADQLPPLLQPFGAVPPLITDIDAVGRRPATSTCPAGAPASSSASTCPTRAQPRETGSVRLGGIVERAAHPAGRPAQRRPADGRDRAATAAAST